MGRLDAVLRASLPGEPERLAALDTAIRSPLPLSTGVGIVGAGRDAPTAVVGGLLAGVLAARRPHRVLAVGARPAAHGIGWHAGLAATAWAGDRDIAKRSAAGTGAEATYGLGRTPGGAWVLDLADEPARWWEAVAPISRFFDFVLTDWGTPSDLDDARATSVVLLVVVAADPAALQSGVDLAAQLATSRVTPLLVMHDTGAGHAPALRTAAAVNEAHWLPADRGLRTSAPTSNRRLRYTTSIAVLGLAAAVVDAAVVRNLEGVPR
jgi:hypothetical protein